MKKSIMTKWVKALRSGKYTQGKYSLRSFGNSFCCLGVLCDIVDPKGWRIDKTDGLYYYGKIRGLLPAKIAKITGIKTPNGLVAGRSLTLMNDEDNVSFKRIANFIEKNYKDL